MSNKQAIRRLPMYLNILRLLREQGESVVSGNKLADLVGKPPPVVKKDLEMTGARGVKGVGYEIRRLTRDIEAFVEWNRSHRAVLVGAGSLGLALLGYEGLRRRGLEFAAAFDNDQKKIGSSVRGVKILPASRLELFVRREEIRLAVVTVPANAAQETAERLVHAGIDAIWNFAPVVLTLPEYVAVQREDLSAGLAELLVDSKRKRTKADGVGPDRPEPDV